MRRAPAAAVGAADQLLAHHALQALGQGVAHLCVVLRGVRVHDAIDGLRRAARVQRAQHQVPGLCGLERERDGVHVAELADEDHVRVLAQSGPQSVLERAHVRAELALHDLGARAPVHELDRILEREDVERLALVDLADHRRQRRGLAGARGPGHEHQAVGEPPELRKHAREPQLRHARHRLRDDAAHSGQPPAPVEDVHAKAARSLGLVAKIHRAARRADGPLLVGDDLAQEIGALHVRQGPVRDRHEQVVQADERRQTHGEVDVRAALLPADLEERVDAGHAASSGSSDPSRGAPAPASRGRSPAGPRASARWRASPDR